MYKLSLFLCCLLGYASIQAQNKPKVLATTTMIADMARNVAGDKLDVICLLPTGSDPHLFEPTPKDVSLTASANLILKNGLTLEGWISKLIASSGTKANVVELSQGVAVIESQTYAGSPDPHAWGDAQNAKIYVKNIEMAFQKLDPANARFYAAQALAYSQKLDSVDTYIKTEIAKIPEKKRVLITAHDAFHYYGKAYGLQVEASMGTSTDADVRTSDMQRLSKLISERNIPAIFVESTINPKLLQQLAKDKGIVIGGKLYSDSLGEPGTEPGTYIGMLLHNTKTIVGSLAIVRKIDNSTPPEKSGNYFFLVLLGMGFALALTVLWLRRR
jgi:ABC-type Zn uptake system ZnuABC Zn-binding protein ZnuA